jgi:hypothetical protein
MATFRPTPAGTTATPPARKTAYLLTSSKTPRAIAARSDNSVAIGATVL